MMFTVKDEEEYVWGEREREGPQKKQRIVEEEQGNKIPNGATQRVDG